MTDPHDRLACHVYLEFRTRLMSKLSRGKPDVRAFMPWALHSRHSSVFIHYNIAENAYLELHIPAYLWFGKYIHSYGDSDVFFNSRMRD